VREQIDQGLDFIPSALRDSLHDTRLEPTDRTPDLRPVDGMPVGRTPGSRTSEHFCRRHICLSPLVGWPRFSRDGRPERSQPAFAARGCRPLPKGRPAAPARPTPVRRGPTLYPTHYRSAFASSLIPSPLPHQPPLQSAFPCGETTGLLRSSRRSLRGKVVPFGRWRVIRDGGQCSPRTWPRTFWSKPNSILGLSLFTAF